MILEAQRRVRLSMSVSLTSAESRLMMSVSNWSLKPTTSDAPEDVTA